jgi:CDP-glucose 4,6-dehydratase
LVEGESICTSVISDLRNKTQLEQEIVSFQPDFIFHLAAQPLVRLSYEIPAETFEVNVIGTANVLDAVRLLQKKCVVVLITTDKVYHNNEWIYPYRENDRLGGYDPYSASKACAELVIDSYRNSFFNLNDYASHQKTIVVARAGNVIGGGDWSQDRLIPDIAKAFAKEKPVVIRNPKSVRPWQHVLEPTVGYLTLGANLDNDHTQYSAAYNFGPHLADALTVKEMLVLAIESWGKGEFIEEILDGQPHEAGLLKLDISKAIKELKWQPKLNAKEAVSMTMDWYRAFEFKQDEINDFTESQIKLFLQ